MRTDLMFAVAIGAAGGALVLLITGTHIVTGPILGAVTGAIVALLAGSSCVSPGAGMLWGMAIALLAWLVGPVWFGEVHAAGCTISSTQDHLPLLAGYLLLIGLPVGLYLGIRNRFRLPPPPARVKESWARTLTVGGTCGVASTALFGLLGIAPTTDALAPLLPHDAADWIIGLLRIPTGMAFGLLFGLLFQRDMKGCGSSAGWGFGYGMLWWFLVPQTLGPLLSGAPLPWYHQAVTASYPDLVSHALLGLAVGLTHALSDRAWVTFFHDSDPLNREPGGPGPKLLGILGAGSKAGLLGGALACLPMSATGILPYVATLVGAESALIGAAVHLVIASTFGALYGLLFHDEAPDRGAALGWGMFYGLILWFVGQITVFSWLIDGTFSWTAADVGAALPSLISHLAYGMVTGLVFAALFRPVTSLHPLHRQRVDAVRRFGTPAPALWLVALVIGVLFPILLSGA